MRGGDRAALRSKNGQGAKGQGGLKASVAAYAGGQSIVTSGCIRRPNLNLQEAYGKGALGAAVAGFPRELRRAAYLTWCLDGALSICN